MAEFEYVHKKEYYPVKHEQKTILDRVVSIMQREYDLPGVRYRLIGSGDRHLVTRIKGGNKGFDLDYNIILPPLKEGWSYKPKVIADQFMQAFQKACRGTSYSFPKHRTSVIQLKHIDKDHSKVIYGGDFAIIYYGDDESEGYYYLKEAFERLEGKKSKIEEFFGDKLDWYSSREGSEAKRIIYKREADVFNPSKQEEYFAWMIDKCDELSNALVQVGEMDEEAQEKDKFTKLKQYLENCGKTELILTFADIEAIIGCTLCKSAYNYSAYWNPSPTHTMPNTILSAGYKIVSVDLISKELVMQKQ